MRWQDFWIYRSRQQNPLVKHFENNDEEYIKIRRTVEEKALGILSDRKALLKLAVLSVAESIENDPDKYSYLIHYHRDKFSSSPSFKSGGYTTTSQYYSAASYTYESPFPPTEQEHCIYHKMTILKCS